MSLCATCIHNTANDRSMIAELDAVSQEILPQPRCEMCQPIFPDAEQCTMHFDPPMDGD